MGRTESRQVAQQGMAQSVADQANATADRAGTLKSLGDHSRHLDSFMKYGRKVYGEGGEYAKTQNVLANTTAAAGETSLKGNLALNAARTGENTAGYADTVAESKRQSERDLTSQLAGADAGRLDKLTAINQYGVDASALPAHVQASLYGTGTGGAGNQLSSAAGAAQTPGFWDTFAPALVGGAGAAARGFIPRGGTVDLTGIDMGAGANTYNPHP
jgi:hypothetical protein